MKIVHEMEGNAFNFRKIKPVIGVKYYKSHPAIAVTYQ